MTDQAAHDHERRAREAAIYRELGARLRTVRLACGVSQEELAQRLGIERVTLDQRDFQYLYREGDDLVFMDQENYEQITMAADFLGERVAFLQDGMVVKVELHEGTPIGVEMPPTVILEIIEADPVVKGQTASSSYKPAKLENGIRVMVPPFITTGEKIVVNTNELTYVERAR